MNDGNYRCPAPARAGHHADRAPMRPNLTSRAHQEQPQPHTTRLHVGVSTRYRRTYRLFSISPPASSSPAPTQAIPAGCFRPRPLLSLSAPPSIQGRPLLPMPHLLSSPQPPSCKRRPESGIGQPRGLPDSGTAPGRRPDGAPASLCGPCPEPGEGPGGRPATTTIPGVRCYENESP